jgi:hypothetical protein
MSETSIRPEVVALFADLDLKGTPDQWTHMDGSPVTRDELDLALSATRDELVAVRDYSVRLTDYYRERDAAFTRVQELAAPYFADLPEGASLARVLPLMPAAERAELVELMDLLAPDGTVVPPTA